jgi:Xaa-Pro dipeptidase
MEGINSDSGASCKPASFSGDNAFASRVDTSALFHAVSTARVTKSPAEIEAMRYSAYVASNAHVEVMRFIRPGIYIWTCVPLSLSSSLLIFHISLSYPTY